MDASSVVRYLGEDWTSMVGMMRDALKSDISLLDRTNEAVLSNAGKMLRPMLSLLVARACGGSANEASLRFAAATELLHNATLFHDDVADASNERRGAPTVASMLGNTASVLLGDFWLVKAMDQILSTGKLGNSVIRVFAKTLSDLAEGEMLQLEKAKLCDTSREDYFRIIYSKTASLFEASCVSAAMSVGAPDDVVSAVREYGVRLGLAFQVKDDIMDYAPDAPIGKPTGVDLMEQKITIPLLCALNNVDGERGEAVRRLVRDIHSNPGSCAEARAFVEENGGIEGARECLEDLIGKAKAALSLLPESEEKHMLLQLAEYTAYRTK